MVNVGTGNLLVQADDVDIPERGIDLAFRRTYNSQSAHDALGTDGAPVSLYGNGWTSTFDVHLAYNSDQNVMSVYDLDGARYDYASNGSGGWTPPPGMQGTSLTWDGTCGYYWTKKTGTSYYFYAPAGASCTNSTAAGYRGRLYMIFARNHNNNLTFTYSWSPDATNAENLTEIVVQHSDGDKLTLSFAQFGTSGTLRTELATITRPDNQTITYDYDTNGELLAVQRPGNALDDATRAQTITALTEQYAYYGNGYQLETVMSPRYVWSSEYTPGAPDGTYETFSYDGTNVSAHVTAMTDYGVMNITPNDGMSTPLQPGSMAGLVEWLQETFSGWGSGTTTVADTQGHDTVWTVDASDRVTQTQAWTGTQYLVTSGTWDSNNDLTAAVDARGNETDYTYDGNGNTLSVAQPLVSTSMGSGRPTARYSYDSYNNLVAFCDPNQVWSSGESSCAAVSGTTYYLYNYSDPNEPFGQLTDTYAPLGYHHHITYDSGDTGLPIEVQGDSITQNDGSVRTPTQTFAYDAYGNLTSYNKGNGAWSMTYDLLHRLLTRTDPDNVTSYTCYNLDGSTAYTETAYQHYLDATSGCQSTAPAEAVSYTYDVDGNTLSETHHVCNPSALPCPPAVTTKWYDGEDRLVEVAQPHDATYDVYTFAWLTRYIYDNSAQQPVSITGGTAGFQAYGNLYKTQECLNGTSVTISAAGTVSGCSFEDVRGNTFDALDRSLTKVEVAVGSAPEATTVYDANGDEGLVAETITGTNQTDTLSYDADGRVSGDSFNDGTPNRTYLYDPDGHQTSLTSATLGTEQRVYDADGRMTQRSEAGGIPDPGVFSYSYYGDGMRSSLGLEVAGLSYSQANLFAYSYRADGLRSSLVTMASGSAATFAWTYTNAGRELTESDPATGVTLTNPTVKTTLTYQPTTYAYDAYGRISLYTAPTGETLTPNWDPENHNWAPGYTYTVRGELSSSPTPGTLTARSPSHAANGTLCWQCVADARSGQMQVLTTIVPTNTSLNYTDTYSYDAAGRQIGDVSTNQTSAGACTGPSVTNTRSYDAENHVLTQTFPVSSQCTDAMSITNAWGPDGHLATQTIFSQINSMHWDGDDLVYSVSQNGMAIGIEKLAVYEQTGYPQSSGIIVIDRDWTGQERQTHTQLGFSGWNMNAFAGLKAAQALDGTPAGGSLEDPSPTWTVLALNPVRSDGYSDGYLNYQGVRAYDPNANQWTSPDAYSGDVHDPMSQKPYMYNNNNPDEYSDPSGYDVLLDFVEDGAGRLGHVQIITFDNNSLKGTINSLDSQHGLPVGDKVKVSHTLVQDVSKLPTQGHTYVRISTTDQQNTKIIDSYDSHKGQNYNLITNNCETTANSALQSVGKNEPLGADPNIDALYMNLTGAATNPSSITSQSSTQNSGQSSGKPN